MTDPVMRLRPLREQLPAHTPLQPDWLTARLIIVRDPDTGEVLGSVLIDGPTGQLRTGGVRTPIYDALTRRS